MADPDLSDLPETLTVGLLQIASLPGDSDESIRANFAEMERLVDAAARGGARLVVMPEYWPFGFLEAGRLREIAEPCPGGPAASFLVRKAREHCIYISGGTFCERGTSGEVYNTSLFLGPDGSILNRHRKVHLYSPLDEDQVFTAGDDFAVCATPFGNAGFMTCYDGDFPETPRLLKLMGAHILLQGAAYESPLENWWQVLYNAHALANAVWIVQVGLAGDYQLEGRQVHCFGMSRVVAPTGEQVASAAHYPAGTPAAAIRSEALLVALDYRRSLEIARASQECLTFDRRPDVYGPLAR